MIFMLEQIVGVVTRVSGLDPILLAQLQTAPSILLVLQPTMVMSVMKAPEH